METRIVSASAEETEAVAERLGRTLGPGGVVALTGELGTGKTCFVQGLARGLGVTTRPTSPTFVLISHYRGRLSLHHVDAYRAGSLAELSDLGLEELFGGEGVTVVEWAEKLVPLLPPHTIQVHIEGVGDEPRAITITAPRDA